VSQPSRQAFRAFLAQSAAGAADGTAGRLVEIRPLFDRGPVPLLVRATVADVDLAGWAAERTDWIRSRLLAHGGVLFRDFAVSTVADFQRLVALFDEAPLAYADQHTPRTHVDGGVYTSTEYPADHHVPLHSENSKNREWPRKVWFYCQTPAATGGETPVADNRRVYELVPARLRQRFEERGVQYVRNFGQGVGVSWQQAFQTADQAAVERICLASGTEFEWRSGGGLRTRSAAHAVMTHPQTGERLWFNQAHLFHSSSLRADVRDALRATLSPPDLPSNALYGDGTPIDDAEVAAIVTAFKQATVVPPWRRGDVHLLDNMLLAHGRRPYAGQRRVLVAMAERYQRDGSP
jgi:alpha-ketoglutarate-dependent taurine dioxygenase